MPPLSVECLAGLPEDLVPLRFLRDLLHLQYLLLLLHRHLQRRVGMQSLPSSPPGPTPLAAPPNAEAWRSRFVISAKANTPTLTLLGSGHEPPIHRLVEATCAALDSKTPPMLVDDGLGGTYFIKGLDGTCDWPRSNLGRTDLPIG